MSHIRPETRILNQEQKEQIHKYSLELLSSVGVRVDSERARQVFTRTIGNSSVMRRIRIPATLVEFALKFAPPTLDIYDRAKNFAFKLRIPQNTHTSFGIGVTNLYYQESETD